MVKHCSGKRIAMVLRRGATRQRTRCDSARDDNSAIHETKRTPVNADRYWMEQYHAHIPGASRNRDASSPRVANAEGQLSNRVRPRMRCTISNTMTEDAREGSCSAPCMTVYDRERIRNE